MNGRPRCLPALCALAALLASGCYAGRTYELRVRDPSRVAIGRRVLTITGPDDGTVPTDAPLLPPDATDRSAVLHEDPAQHETLRLVRAGGEVRLTCTRCQDATARVLLHRDGLLAPVVEGTDQYVRGDVGAVRWTVLPFGSERVSVSAVAVFTRADVVSVRRHETPSRGAGWVLLATGLGALGMGGYGLASGDAYIIAIGAAVGVLLGTIGVWNLAAPARTVEEAP